MGDGTTQPTDGRGLLAIGHRAELWTELCSRLAASHDHVPEFVFGGRNYGWFYPHRRGGTTLVTLYPEYDRFTVPVVLGKHEVTAAEQVMSDLSARVRTAFSDARQLPDGRWLWIRPAFGRDIESIETLLALKRRPKSRTRAGEDAP